LYAHNTGPVVVVWLNAVTIIAWLKSKTHDGQGGFMHPDWWLWIAGQLGVALLWSPWLLSRFVQLQGANSALNTPPQFGFQLLSQMWQALWTGPWAMVGREQIIVVMAGLLFLAALFILPWRTSGARWLMLHLVILTGGLILGLWVIGNEMHGRYLVMVAPLLLIAMCGGLSYLNSTYLRNGLIMLSLLVFILAVHFSTQNPAYGHDDARGMVQYYADNLTAEDSVLAWSYADRYDLAYYWGRLDVQAMRITLPEGADLETVLPLLPRSGDVALNVWYTQRADFRGMMACVLGHGTPNLPEEFTVNGMSNQLYRSPVPALSQLRPVEVTLADNGSPIARLTAVGDFPAFTADQGLCLPIQMTILQDIDVDLKAALVITNDLGWEVARTDAIFATANQRTSSQLSPGEMLMAYPLLRLPYGAPAGDYAVRLRVYDEVDETSGYDFALPGSLPPIKNWLIGTWRVLPGADWSQVNHDTDLPVRSNLAVSENLILIAHNLIQQTVRNGDRLRLALLWQGGEPLPELVLAAEDGSWHVKVPSNGRSSGNTIALDWREVQMPLDAKAGAAELRLDDGTVIAQLVVEVLPALYTPPEFGAPVGIEFPGVGTLLGYTPEHTSFDRNEPIPVTLVWLADETVARDYTVFVQLIVEDRVVAQSDAVPAQGSRPTSGWRTGEYIIDQHYLSFHEDAIAGEARLIAGLYDAATGERVRLDLGEDAVTLAEELVVR
jgi:hypothetical protein